MPCDYPPEACERQIAAGVNQRGGAFPGNRWTFLGVQAGFLVFLQKLLFPVSDGHPRLICGHLRYLLYKNIISLPLVQESARKIYEKSNMLFKKF